MAYYNHTQSSASATWTIVHNLDDDVVTSDVLINYNGSLQKVLPKTVYRTDNNTLTVEFSEAQSGVARVVATDSIT